jgi:nitrogen fixation NifU-like protein
MYSSKLLDHFEHPRNVGEIPGADVFVRLENPACGDILELQLKIVDDTIADIRFRAKGCVPAMACASALTELVKGKTTEEAGKLTKEDVIHEVGELPPASSHAAQLAIDGLQTALRRVTE